MIQGNLNVWERIKEEGKGRPPEGWVFQEENPQRREKRDKSARGETPTEEKAQKPLEKRDLGAKGAINNPTLQLEHLRRLLDNLHTKKQLTKLGG